MTNKGALHSETLVRRFGIPKMGRYSCKCGKWINLPPTYTKENPLVCSGITIESKCGLIHYWENGAIFKNQ